MKPELILCGPEHAELLHRLKRLAFLPLYRRYHDEGNPALESLEKLQKQLYSPHTDYYRILIKEQAVGGMRLDKSEPGTVRIAPVYVLPEYAGQGIGAQVLRQAELLYPAVPLWRLDTILQEELLCRFYEGLGYRRTSEKEHHVAPNMTIVFYEKEIMPRQAGSDTPQT